MNENHVDQALATISDSFIYSVKSRGKTCSVDVALVQLELYAQTLQRTIAISNAYEFYLLELAELLVIISKHLPQVKAKTTAEVDASITSLMSAAQLLFGTIIPNLIE